ncbi:TraY domain-containing protein [Serratia liquefaciens]|uniref:TraY domain-containing protein n=1 Tax=Serratia liquefaciens TaxID=614 RepID=UPI0022BA06B9|nr:TraY domain-containing protein [Serratia liquefaciens]
MEKSQSEHEYSSVTITLQLGAAVNELLTHAAKRSGRTKRQEALLRLTDHLQQVRDIATQGKSFKF